MERISLALEKPYSVYVGRGILRDCAALCGHPPCRLALVSDSRVDALYGDGAAAAFAAAGFQVERMPFLAGEENKNLQTLGTLLEDLAERQLTRSDLIVALGGGVTGDLAGFAAAVYLRGLPFVQIPTSLLAMVDASVGGKTAVDLRAGKNLAGSFHQPIGVICDTALLDSLSPARFAEGAAESLKCGAIFDEALFERIAAGGLSAPGRDGIIADCIRRKARVVEADPLDRGQRQLLNFGHTPAHAIERCSHYAISHGEAVAMGMALMTRAAERRGFCPGGSAERMRGALKALGLPADCPYGAETLAQAALSDKKRAGDSIQLVLPERIGRCVLHSLPIRDLASFFQEGLS